MRGRKKRWIALLTWAALFGVAGGASGCASGGTRLPHCTGQAVPINVSINVPGNAGSVDRGD